MEDKQYPFNPVGEKASSSAGWIRHCRGSRFLHFDCARGVERGPDFGEEACPADPASTRLACHLRKELANPTSGRWTAVG